MESIFSRTENLIGKEALERLKCSTVAVFGLGGVGGYTVEALVRAGVGNLVLVDSDKVERTNLNRQIIATSESIGMDKTAAARRRALSVNPDVKIEEKTLFFCEETCNEIDFSRIDYVADAIDSVKSKVLLIRLAHEKNVPIISCMGAGNKLDPTRFVISSIKKTQVCPLAKAVRTQLRRYGITDTPVVWSDEPPVSVQGEERVPSSISFVPSVAGLLMAYKIITDIIKES